ncbi:MAG: succinyl-diaminopimelate desuccinylase [Candidatus Liberibacter europaeus]|uniref:Succinyl-diaminopimelate desuccinylase n=1 Tax=Candidatus Liberibacter europaeus TaxID=744859 RepID=A0A2T4VZ08_9HYPH|nr:succinyl-diaminopimelate desuccinylase [Candidatus Liberibacter europaeus]PTL87022.1 MAG: succinyl-diaminopimelate desuccinylase [Candidatus Liberibacter europaeus]
MVYTDCLTNLIKLINCPSITPNDGGSTDVLINILKPIGFSINKQVFQEEKTVDVTNIYARFGKKDPHLMFAGHIDVVSPGILDEWKYPPFSATIEDDRLYGRGAVDMKGGIACFITAVARFISRNNDFGSISMLITGDEEGPAINGTKKMLLWAKQKQERWNACIVGEPTCSHKLGDTVKIGRRGSLSGDIIIHGKQGHVAYQHLANNPINGIIPLLQQLTCVDFDNGNTDFPPTHLEITTIDVGNSTLNLIPGQVRISFNIRFNNIWNEKTLKEEVTRRVKKSMQNSNQNNSLLSHDLHFKSPISPVFLTENKELSSLLIESITDVTGEIPKLSTSGGTSDARFIKDYCPVIEFGLIGQTMHSTNENVSIADLKLLTCIYDNFISKWFAKNGNSQIIPPSPYIEDKDIS